MLFCYILAGIIFSITGHQWFYIGQVFICGQVISMCELRLFVTTFNNA